MNSFIFGLLPGNGSLRPRCNCGTLLDEQVTLYPPMAGSGVHLAPQQEHEGGALVVLLALTSSFTENLLNS